MRKQRRRTAKLISAFALATWTVQYLFFLKLNLEATIFCGFTARSVSDLNGNPERWFSHDEPQLSSKIQFDSGGKVATDSD